LNQVQGDALRGTRPDTGQAIQRGHERCNWFGKSHVSISFYSPPSASFFDREDEKEVEHEHY
jgi:hypothetical protein